MHGLDIAWKNGYRRVILELDSQLVVGWLRSSGMPRLSLVNLVDRCMALLSKPWEVKIEQVYRE